MGDPVLLGDIGATNARFAFLSDGALSEVHTFQVAKFAAFADVLSAALGKAGPARRPAGAVLAVAGPVEAQRSVLTNCGWVIDATELQGSFGLRSRILNDFEAVALSLPSLTENDLESIGGKTGRDGAPRAVLGPGSGLGVACLVGDGADPVVIASEGGHATLAGGTDREDEILRMLRRRFGHASAERAISGSGLENIYQAIAALDGTTLAPSTAPEITERALKRECPVADEALRTFCALLGSFAGNVALTFGATGGVYLAGGIAPRILDFLHQSEFRLRFESKGRFRDYLAAIPCYVIVHPAAALLGLKSVAERAA